MKGCWLILPVLAASLAQAADPGPNFHEEILRYNISWPSGLSLGEAEMRALHQPSGGPEGARWRFEFDLDAAVPGFQVKDRVRSLVTDAFCTVEYDKDTAHGKRKAQEKTTVDLANGLATRATLNGGKSEIPVGACPHDALSFLYHLRREISQGRLPRAQAVLFGALYHIKLEYGGTRQIEVGGSAAEADRLVAAVKGPSSEVSFELFVARDSARTPLLVRVPLPLGSFSMELVR